MPAGNEGAAKVRGDAAAASTVIFKRLQLLAAAQTATTSAPLLKAVRVSWLPLMEAVATEGLALAATE